MSHSVIILLGYKNQPNGHLHPIAQQRANKALEVYQQLGTTTDYLKLICTGGIGEKFNQSKTAHGKLLQAYLQAQGIHNEAFLSHAASKNTYEDGRFCKDIIQEQKDLGESIDALHLVTSEFHMERASLWFDHFFPKLKITCHPAKTITTKSDMQSLRAHEKQAIANFYRDFPEKL